MLGSVMPFWYIGTLAFAILWTILDVRVGVIALGFALSAVGLLLIRPEGRL